jgi:hypothetical protein
MLEHIQKRLLMSTLLRGMFVFALLLAAGCTGQRGQRLEDIPTPAQFDALATAQAQTANAPPPGFRDSVSFPEVDANLDDLDGARYEVQLEFDGVFARTTRTTSATTHAQISFNRVGSSRRVLVQTAGELLGRPDSSFEAVRLGPDSFLVQNGQCLTEGVDAQTAAVLRAGTLIGGVTQAVPVARKAVINGEEAWQYVFTADALNLPNVHLEQGGTLNLAGGELWVAPARNVVVRFYLNLDVTNAVIFDRQLPVSGQILIRYDLYDAGKTTNITVPFGC